MRSPLEIRYDEVVKNPGICRENPMSSTPGIDGSILLWEGFENHNNKQSPMYRVFLMKNGLFQFKKLNKMYNEWRIINRLEPIRFFRRKKENVPEGRIRIEVYANGNTKRTTG